MAGEPPGREQGVSGPDPQRVHDLVDLARELDLLRARAARGSRRRRIGLDALAARVDVPRSTVHAYATGKHLPPADVLDGIVIALGATSAEQRQWSEAWFRVSAGIDTQRRLRADTGPAPVPPPRQLPSDVDSFTGRDGELARLDEVLADADHTGAAVATVAVVGCGGVGKTALAVHWAHRVADRFPDGQLWADLRGYDPDQPVAPAEVLAGFLRGLGVADSAIPPGVAERSARYRSLLADRRILVLLDNARDAEQVRDLLPGTSSCLVVVTSRDSLAGLVVRHGARRVPLDTLPPDDAVALLSSLAGDRAEAEAAAVATVAERCGRLPLALRIAAELAAARPHATFGELAGGLADEGQRLNLLDVGTDPRVAVRAVFSWSYRCLPADAARTFRLLGLPPGPHIDQYAAAALIGAAPGDARRLLGVLVRAHLLQEPHPDRYAMHDLLRVWAAERARDEETGAGRAAAMTRLLDHHVHAAATAMTVLHPDDEHRRPRVAGPATATAVPADRAAARGWLDTQRPNFAAVATLAGDPFPWPRQAIQLSAVLWRYLDTGAHYAEAQALHECALSAARHTRDVAAQASALVCLGGVSWRTGRHGEAADRYQRALSLFRDAGDDAGQARALSNLGAVYMESGRYEQAGECLRSALALEQRRGDRTGQAHALNSLGALSGAAGRYDEAVAHLTEALALRRAAGDRVGEATTLTNLGMAYGKVGRPDRAVEHLERAVAISRESGSPVGEARALTTLGNVHADAGRPGRAVGSFQEALARYAGTANPAGEAEVLAGLGAVYVQVGQGALAERSWRGALTRYDALAMPAADEVREWLRELPAGD